MESTLTQNTSFTVLRTYYEAYQKMDDTAKLQYMGAIMAFAFDGEEPHITDPMADMAFTLIRPTLENSVRYHAIKRICGSLGGRPKKTKAENNQTETETKPNKNQTETKTKPNDNQTETEKKRESDSESEYESDNESESEYDLPAAKAAYVAPQAQRVERMDCSASDFERLWQAYPRKEDRQEALKKYYEVNLPSSLLIPVIEAQKAFYAKKKHPFIPKLSTWLDLGMYSGTACVGEDNRIALYPKQKKCAGE